LLLKILLLAGVICRAGDELQAAAAELLDDRFGVSRTKAQVSTANQGKVWEA